MMGPLASLGLACSSAGSTLQDRIAGLSRLLHPGRLIRLELEGVDLFAKTEFHGLGCTVKDAPAFWILRRAIERGDIDESSTIVESSSGNFATALAVLCRLLKLPFVAVIDPLTADITEVGLRALCAEVIKVTEAGEAGYLVTRLERTRRFVRENPNAFWTNQYENQDAVMAHYLFTAQQLCRLPALDYVFIAVSTAGTVAGVSRRLKERFPRLNVIAVDAEGSAITGPSTKRRRIPGFGAGIRPPLLDGAQVDEVVVVREASTIAGCRELLDRHGILAGGSSGAVYAAAKATAAKLHGSVRPTMAFLCADHGRPYLSTIFNDAWATQGDR